MAILGRVTGTVAPGAFGRRRRPMPAAEVGRLGRALSGTTSIYPRGGGGVGYGGPGTSTAAGQAAARARYHAILRAQTRAHYAQLRRNAQIQRNRAVARARTRTAYARGQGTGQRLARVHGTASVGTHTVGGVGALLSPARGASVGGVIGSAASGLGPAPLFTSKIFRQAGDVGEAFVRDPLGVGRKTVTGLKDAAIGFAPATVNLVTHPLHVGEQLLKDTSRRYAHAGTEANVHRIMREGAAPETLDFTAAGSAGGAVLGRALGAGARAGMFGGTVEKIAAADRPALRVSGGIARTQKVSPNLFVAGAQRLQDVARASRTEGRAARAVSRGGRLEALQPARPLVRAGPVRSLRPARALVHQPGGEVTPYLRRLGGFKQERSVSRVKSRAVQALKNEQRNVLVATRKDISSLNPHERAAHNFVARGLVPAAEPARSVEALHRLRASMVSEREATGAQIPRVLKSGDTVHAIDNLIQNADKAFTPKLQAVAQRIRERALPIEAKDPTLVTEQRLLRRYAPQAESLGVLRREGEKTPSYIRRVRVEAEKQGLERPMYIKSQKRFGGPFSGEFADFAVGGARAARGDKHYTGSLFRTGREITHPQVMFQGLAKNIKRKHNWALVREQFHSHTFPWARNKSVNQLLDAIDHQELDPNQIGFWNPGKFDQEAKTTGLAEEVSAGTEVGAHDVSAALDRGDVALSGKEFLARAKAGRLKGGGWHAMPIRAFQEIKGETKPSGILGRGWDITKGKQARIMLGSNPPWEMAQIAANTLQSVIGTKGDIGSLIRGPMFFHSLAKKDPAAWEAIKPYMGVSAFGHELQQVKMGAAMNNGFVNAYRAFKEHPFFHTPIFRGRGPSVSQLNPLDALFRVDNAQNNAFRKGVLYSGLKREAYRRMGENANTLQKIQQRITRFIGLDPENMIRELAKDKGVLEDQAQRVDDILGDYLTYTNKERRFFYRVPLFGGWLRYSIRLVLWTLPVKHPLATSIMGKLGQLQSDETKQLLGPGVKPYQLGNFNYTVGGKLREIKLTSMNPAMNMLTEVQGFHSLGNLLPPVVTMVLDQLYSKRLFQNRPFLVQGESKYKAAERTSYPLSDRLKIALNDALSLAWPYRTAQKIGERNVPQSDTSLPWAQVPTKYKRADIVASIAKEKREAPIGSKAWLQAAFPMLPHPGFRPPQTEAAVKAAKVSDPLHQVESQLAALRAKYPTDRPAPQPVIDQYLALLAKRRQLMAAHPRKKSSSLSGISRRGGYGGGSGSPSVSGGPSLSNSP